MVWAGQELVVRGEGQGGARGLQKEVHMGAAEPLPVGTVAQQEGGRGGPMKRGPPFCQRPRQDTGRSASVGPLASVGLTSSS